MPYEIETKDGIVIRNIPDEIKPDSPELRQRVQQVRTANAPQHRGPVPNDLAPMPAKAEPRGLLTPELPGMLDAGLTMLTGALAAPIGHGAGILSTLTSGKFGTPEGIRAGQDTTK